MPTSPSPSSRAYLHRQEFGFINDSKANYDTAPVGLASVDSPAISIARGEAKPDSIWIQTIQAKAAAVLLIADAATAFAQRLDEIVETMERAIFRTAQLAKQYQARVVLLPVGCAIMRSRSRTAKRRSR